MFSRNIFFFIRESVHIKKMSKIGSLPKVNGYPLEGIQALTFHSNFEKERFRLSILGCIWTFLEL